MRARRGRSALSLAIALWFALQVGVAWAPFQFDPPRRATNAARHIDGGGLSFEGVRAVALANPPVPWNQVEALGVNLLVRTTAAWQDGPARILTISEDHRRANLVVAQGGSDLLIRVRRPGSRLNGEPAFRVPGVFGDDSWKRLRLELTDAVRVTVNGAVVVDEQLTRSPFEDWHAGHALALGDERRGERQWTGWIMEADLIVDGLRYRLLQDEHVIVPDQVWLATDRLSGVTAVPSGRSLVRSALHFAGFALGGALMAAHSRLRQRALSVALLACFFSVALQLGKVFVAGRHPAVFTIAAQVGGALLGAVAVRAIGSRR